MIAVDNNMSMLINDEKEWSLFQQVSRFMNESQNWSRWKF